MCVTEGETDMPLGIPTWAEYRSRQVEVSMAAGYIGLQGRRPATGRGRTSTGRYPPDRRYMPT